jgi:hypothetical protein
MNIDINGRLILSLPMQENDADAKTIRDYLLKLLHDVWNEGEGFDGKRPFGNSDWDSEVYETLARAGLIDSTKGDDGCLYDFDMSKGDALVKLAIDALGA